MHENGGITFAGDENPYLAAFLWLKCDLLVLQELNAIVPKAIENHVSKKETFLSMPDTLLKELRKGKTRSDAKEFLGKKMKEQTEIFERVIQSVKQARKEADTKGTKLVFLGLDEKTTAGKAILDVMRYGVFPKQFTTFIRNMSLVYLVVLFENYLAKVLRVTMQNEPRVLMTCQKSITIEDLLKLDKIEDARKQIIDKEISDIISEDLDKLAEYFEDKFNLKLAEVSDWSQFKERFYRRNIIVHNSGYPNKLYRQKTGYRGKDKKMDVTETYLQYSINLFGKWAMGISMFLTQKFVHGNSREKHHKTP